MSVRNASGYDDWQQSDEPVWDEGAYDAGYAEEAPRKSFLQRIWTGRPMIYILAAGLIVATALVLITRPGGEPVAAPATAAPAAAPAIVTYDAGPVIENELNKP